MRILIVGNKGQAGQAICRTLMGRNTKAQVSGFSDTETDGAKADVIGYDLPEVDISERAAVVQLIEQHEPDVVINCAAYTNVDGAVKNFEIAYRANGLGPQNLALTCAAHGIDLVQISSNEVFPGEKAEGYDEWDPTRPLNPYAKSKLAGEFNVRSLHRQHYIVRTSWLYAAGGRNFIHTMLRLAREHGKLRVVTDEVSNPTYVDDLAVAIAQLIETRQYGTYHLGNAGFCSRFEFAAEIMNCAGLDVPMTPISSDEFKRPSTPPPYCGINNNVGAAIGIEMRDWRVALAEFIGKEVA